MAVTSGYPVTLDVARRLIVIVGGGHVAVRKARGLIEAGATHITVVAPEILDQMPVSVRRISERYRPEHLAGAFLVFAATDSPDVNRQVLEDAHAIGALVNRADSEDGAEGDFSTPAAFRQGDLMLTVSTAGSPALAGRVRDAIAAWLDPRWSAMAGAMKELRPRVLATDWPIEIRRQIFRRLAADEAMALLADRGLEAVWEWAAAFAREATQRSAEQHQPPAAQHPANMKVRE